MMQNSKTIFWLRNLFRNQRDTSPFLKHILSLGTGVALAQIVIVIGAPILTRIYTPDDYGLFSILIAIIAIASSIGTWRYDMSIVLPKSDEQAAHLVVFATILIVITGIAITLFFTLLSIFGQKLLPIPRLGLLLILLCILSECFGQVCTYWASRHSQFKNIALAKANRSFVSTFFQITAGLLVCSNPLILLIGYFLGQLTALFILIKKTFIGNMRAIFTKKNVRECSLTAKSYQNIAIHALPTSFLNTLSSRIFPLVMAGIYSTHIVGIMLIAERVLALPAQVITQSIWQVTYSRFRSFDSVQRSKHIYNTHLFVSYLLAFPSAFIVMFSSYFTTIFGSNWNQLDLLFPCFAIMIYCNSVSNATSYFVAFKKYRQETLANVFLLSGRIIAILLASRFLSSFGTANAYAIVSALIYVAINIYWGFITNNLRGFSMNIGTSWILAVILLLPSYALIHNNFNLFGIALGFISLIAYYTLCTKLIYKRSFDHESN